MLFVMSHEANLVVALMLAAFYVRLPRLLKLILHRLYSGKTYLNAWFIVHFIVWTLGLIGSMLPMFLVAFGKGFNAGLWTAVSCMFMFMSAGRLSNALHWFKVMRTRRPL